LALLISLDRICSQLGIGVSLFTDLVTDGLPAKKPRDAKGSWVTHPEVIDAWLVELT
jgi:hypothetical protein